MNRKSVILIIGALSFSLCAESAFASSVTNYENAAIAAAKKRNEQLKKRRAELETEARKKAQIELEEKQRQEAQQREIEQKAELAAQEQRKLDEWVRQLFIKNFADNIKNLKNCSQDFYVKTKVWSYGEVYFDEIKISDSSVNLIDAILQNLVWVRHPHFLTRIEKLNDPTAKNYVIFNFSIDNKMESYIDSHADSFIIRKVVQVTDSLGVHLKPLAWRNMEKDYFQDRKSAPELTVKLTENDSGEILASEASGEIGRCSIPTMNGTASASEPQVQSLSGLAVIPLRVVTATGDHRFRVEVAASSAQQEKGLMFRNAMGADEGMIFPMIPARPAAFWMHNTVIGLDIIFIGADHKVLNIAANAVPRDETPLPSKGDAAAVLELNAGRAAQIGMKPGDTVSW
jgi:uncharacterized membrane protein (UPF0127 family)